MGAIDRPSIRLDVAHRDESVILGNLLSLYLHDLSPYTGATPGRDGRFAYPRFDSYWTAEGEAEGRVLLLITVEDELVGFVLKNRHSRLGQREQVSSVVEFFVMRKWRRHGVGRIAAEALFDRFAGNWEVSHLRANAPAHAFWLRVIDGYTHGHFTEHNLTTERWNGFVQTFTTPASPLTY